LKEHEAKLTLSSVKQYVAGGCLQVDVSRCAAAAATKKISCV
jgi:hypothetical protein